MAGLHNSIITDVQEDLVDFMRGNKKDGRWRHNNYVRTISIQGRYVQHYGVEGVVYIEGYCNQLHSIFSNTHKVYCMFQITNLSIDEKHRKVLSIINGNFGSPGP